MCVLGVILILGEGDVYAWSPVYKASGTSVCSLMFCSDVCRGVSVLSNYQSW